MITSEVFACFVFYGTLLVIKMYVVAIITGQVRLRKKAFANPEDALRHGGLQYHRKDPYVERCRRTHSNDMENILPFLFLGAIYSMTEPSLAMARLHFLVFICARVVHTLAYLCALPAPTRSVAYTLAQVPCVSMAVQILEADVDELSANREAAGVVTISNAEFTILYGGWKAGPPAVSDDAEPEENA